MDNCTDATMLAEAMHPVENAVLEEAVMCRKSLVSADNLNYVLCMTNYANEVDRYPAYSASYPRYWHGYLVILKILLLFLM